MSTGTHLSPSKLALMLSNGAECATNPTLRVELDATLGNGALCEICLEELQSGSGTTLACGHSYHTCCIIEWFRRRQSRGRCPTCRACTTHGEDRQCESEEDESETLSMHITDMSPRSLHRCVAPWVYSNRGRQDPALRMLISRYMALRRCVRSGVTAGGRRGVSRRFRHSGISLCAYLFAVGEFDSI